MRGKQIIKLMHILGEQFFIVCNLASFKFLFTSFFLTVYDALNAVTEPSFLMSSYFGLQRGYERWTC